MRALARFQMGSWSISPRIYSQILVPLRHLHTNAKPKFITAMDRCFNARHRSSNPVSARKTLTTAPPKFVQRLITARAKLAKQRWSSVQDFCVGLADPSVHELASIAVPNFDWALLERWWTLPERKIARSSPLAIFCAAQNFRSGRRDHQRWPSVYGVALTGGQLLLNGGER